MINCDKDSAVSLPLPPSQSKQADVNADYVLLRAFTQCHRYARQRNILFEHKDKETIRDRRLETAMC